MRAAPLPREVKSDKVKAKFDKGVLTVTMPKAEKAQSRSIAIEEGPFARGPARRERDVLDRLW